MQSTENAIAVVEGDADGDAGRTIGHGLLVASDRVLLVTDDRASVPALPLHVLVPVAAGGGRGEHINVTEVVPSEGDAPCVGLELERAVPDGVEIPDLSEPPAALQPFVADDLGDQRLGGGPPAAAMGLLGGERRGHGGWLCKMFPKWCR